MTEIKIESGLISVLKAINNKVHFALSEFVDNSVQSYLENKKQLEELIPGYRPKIEITVEGNDIYILDNCAGISKKDEERAFSLAFPNPNQDMIGTFGMGMKVSACWFSDTWQVETKAIDEKEVKTFSVDVNKIAKGNMAIGPKTKKSDGRPYTKIYLKNCQQRGIPHTTEISLLKRHIGDIYRFLIKKDIDIYYNDELLIFENPDVKKIPLADDQKKIQMGKINLEEALAYRWHAYIDRIDLGKNKAGKLWAEGQVWLRDQGITASQRGFGIFWKKRLMEGVPGDPWMPGADVWAFEDDEDRKKYAIYGEGANRGRNQRLEGFLHISPNFTKSFQTNKVDWNGKDLELAAELKTRLAKIILSDQQSDKPVDMMHQAENGMWGKLKIKEPKSGGGEPKPPFPPGPPGKPPVIIDPPRPPKPGPLPEPGPEDQFVKRVFKINGINYKTTIYKDYSDSDPFILHNEGPKDTSDEDTKILSIRINLNHIFVQKYFKGGFGDEEQEGLMRFGVAFVLAQEITRANKSKNRARNVLPAFEEIIKDPDF